MKQKMNVYQATIKEIIKSTPNYKIGSLIPDENVVMIDVKETQVTSFGQYYKDMYTGEIYSGVKECYEVGEHIATNLSPIKRKVK